LNIKQDIRFRVYVAFTCICIFGLAIILKAAMVQVKEGPELRSLAKQILTRNTLLPAERGNIYTEDGLLLCSSIPQFDLRVDFSVIDSTLFYENVDALSKALAANFEDQSAAEYRSDLVTAYKKEYKYYLLKRNVPYYDYQQVRSFPIFNKGMRYGGLIVESKTKRINPYGMLAYRTIGLYRENAKTIGIEATCDSILSGDDGSRIERKATGGVWMPLEGSEMDPINGRDIVTTIDIGIQDVAEHALLSILQQYECLYGTVVVMEVPTGKIRAMANLGRQKDGSYWEDFNYAMLPTEPGSTFKLATLTSLLNDGYINVEDDVDCEGGQKRFANRVMHDSHHGLGKLKIREAYAHSSNVAMASLAYRYYNNNPKKFIDNLKKLHLNTRTGIDIAGERRPYMIEPGKSDWSATTLPWMATGYGVLITPLHTCMLYNALANNGKMMKPYLISAIREYGKDVKVFQPKVLEEHIASPDAVKQLQSCTREVAISGTAKHIASPFYQISGKTGTAQVADKGIPYSAKVYQGSFVGYFPSEKPRYTVCVVIRTKPHSNAYYGGTLAAPVFRMVADKIFASGMGIWNGPLDSIAQKTDNNLVANRAASNNAYAQLFKTLGYPTQLNGTPKDLVKLTLDSNKQIKLVKENITYGIVPDVKGLGLKDAVYLLENEGMKISIVGRGSIQGQSIAPGTKVIKGQTIVLTLS
jgi:cell division protein FtsI (penicillin-binding protein 3)